jgi:hypothetical protein
MKRSPALVTLSPTTITRRFPSPRSSDARPPTPRATRARPSWPTGTRTAAGISDSKSRSCCPPTRATAIPTTPRRAGAVRSRCHPCARRRACPGPGPDAAVLHEHRHVPRRPRPARGARALPAHRGRTPRGTTGSGRHRARPCRAPKRLRARRRDGRVGRRAPPATQAQRRRSAGNRAHSRPAGSHHAHDHRREEAPRPPAAPTTLLTAPTGRRHELEHGARAQAEGDRAVGRLLPTGLESSSGDALENGASDR